MEDWSDSSPISMTASQWSEALQPKKKGRYEVGDFVEALCEQDGCWYPASIASQYDDGVFEIAWANNDPRDKIKTVKELRFKQVVNKKVAAILSDDSGSKKVKVPPGEFYNGIGVGIFNDVCKCWKHFQRANEQEGLLENVASPAEWDYIWKHTEIWHPVLANMLAWRRSLLQVLLFCMLVATMSRVIGAWATTQYARADHGLEPMEFSYDEWKARAEAGTLPEVYSGRSGSFGHYSMAVAFESRRLIKGQSDFIHAWESGTIASLSVVAFCLVVLAKCNWVNVRKSRRLILYAWFLTVAAPFIGSMVPARLFVNFGSSAKLVQIYTKSLEKQFNADYTMQQLAKGCDGLKDEGHIRLNQGKNALDKVCNIIGKLPSGTLKIPRSWKIWQKWLRVDMDPAHDGCARARALSASGKPEEALQKGLRACRSMEQMIEEYKATNGQTPDMVKYFVRRCRDIAESSVVMSLAVRNLGTLLPASLSIAPGLLKGANRMKLLVPQSGIPGMFVLVLPWMYCPLTWCIYSVISHMVGNISLLLGLMLLAYQPLIYIIIGWKYQLDKPMTDAQAVTATKAINKWSWYAMLLGYAFIIAFLVQLFRQMVALHARNQEVAEEDWGAGQESQWVEQVVEMGERYYKDKPGRLCWAIFFNTFLLLCSCLEKYYLTGVAGFDWMVGRLVNLRRIERDMDEDITKEYTDRMDQMLSLTSGKKYQDWVQDEWSSWQKKVARAWKRQR